MWISFFNVTFRIHMCHSPHNTPGGTLHQQVMFTPHSSDHATAQKSETRVFFFAGLLIERAVLLQISSPSTNRVESIDHQDQDGLTCSYLENQPSVSSKFSNWNLQFVQGYLCWCSLRLGNLTGSHLEKLNSTNFCPGGFGKSSRWNRRNGQGRVCLCMLRHSAKFSLQVGHWRWFEIHGYLERWYTTYLCTYIKEATLYPVAFKQRVWYCTPRIFANLFYETFPLEEETTEATSRKSWVQSKIKKSMCMLPQSLAHGKTRLWLSKTRSKYCMS